jgi:hypothetical protein
MTIMPKELNRGRSTREPKPGDIAKNTRNTPDPDDHRERRTGGDDREGATEEDVGDRTGPGAGYDKEPQEEDDTGGVTPS